MQPQTHTYTNSYLNALMAISPIDGRYHRQAAPLTAYFSEFGLIKYRVWVEVAYFLELSALDLTPFQHFPHQLSNKIWAVANDFSEEDALKVKEIEKTTNHDVKAVEYFLKDKLRVYPELSPYLEYVHFGLTSQDINNTAIPLSLKLASERVLWPQWEKLLALLNQKADLWANVPMLAHTHGQPASPTRMGKEWRVFAYRLEEQLKVMKAVPFDAKFGGATGNFNAHYVAFPHINWHQFAEDMLTKWGLQRGRFTTQIANYDHLAAFFDANKRLNNILVDFARDVWTYISMDYFKQTVLANEVGSSAMPHKVNPIDFENAEGNLLIANTLFEFLAGKLPVSRLQRDLTDSTVLRNVGTPLAHTHIAHLALQKGINKLELHPEAIRNDLESNWAVVSEAIQTILRRENYPNPYEALKALTRTGTKTSATTLQAFIQSLNVSDAVKQELLSITPFTYVGR